MATQLQLSFNDGLLLLSLIYSAFDLTTEWEQFGTCQRPIHWWLIGSYVCVVTFRLAHLLGAFFANISIGEDFLLDLRQKGRVPKALLVFSWLFCLPFFVLSTFVGTFWLHQVVQHSPTCTPTVFHLWFAGFWLLLCYASVLVYAALAATAWVVERRIRKAERDLQEVAGDSEAASRWGEVGNLASYTSFCALPDVGLSPAQIKALPGLAIAGTNFEDDSKDCCVCCYGEDCSICISTLQQGDSVRRLATCGHVFHRSCIDLWLLRRADCPLCKRSVVASTEPPGQGQWV